MKLEKIKLRNIVNEKLANGELELLKGGAYLVGCTSMLCAHGQEGTEYCTNGDPICKKNLSF
jgi:natural product precursor